MTCLSWGRREPALPQLPGFFLVKIQGAVHKPGFYLVQQGQTLPHVLRKSRPRISANLEQISSEELSPGQTIRIPLFPVVTILLTGAVQRPALLCLPKGTQGSDLAPFDLFLPNADLKKLQKKGPLRDKEMIRIPFQKKN